MNTASGFSGLHQRNTLLYQNVQVVVLDHQCSVDALASSCIKVTSSSIGTSFFIIIISKFKALCFSSTWNVDTYTHTHMSLPNKVPNTRIEPGFNKRVSQYPREEDDMQYQHNLRQTAAMTTTSSFSVTYATTRPSWSGYS
ncbi:hypothetical protein LINPERHAP1_LOCUS25961 [Linum perenne]